MGRRNNHGRIGKIMKKGKGAGFLIGLIAIIAVVGFWAISIVADVMEMREIGYDIVFFENLKVRTITQLIITAVIFGVFFANSFFARKITISRGIDFGIIKSTGSMVRFCLVVSLVAGIFMGNEIYARYMTYVNSVPFGTADPIFGKDVGYYIFERPFLSAVCTSVTTAMLIQAIYTAVLYIVSYAQNDISSFSDILHEKWIMVHVIINVIVYFLAKAASYRFTMEEILYGEFGGLAGAGYTQIHVWQTYFKIAPFVLLAVVFLTILFLLKNKIKPALFSIAAVPVLWMLTFATAGIIQLAVVNPHEVSMEKQYMMYNMEATRAGFGLDKVEEREFDIKNDLTPADLEQNSEIVDNIRITDLNATLTATNSIQGLRTFYTFYDNDVTVYEIDGKKTAVNIGVREFDEKKLQETSQNYINTHLRYTHGYGIVMNAVNTVTAEGQPDYLIKDIPLAYQKGVPEVTQPRIYFGELTDEYAIVGSSYKELDYMDGDKNIEFSYDGEAGINLTPLNRLIFAVKKTDTMLLLSGYINSETKLLPNRNILDRVNTVAPFIEFDRDPYMVITDGGELKWVIDGYVKSDYYPYAQRYEGINYIRNSVKAVVDAYDGTVTFYITDKTEPVINMYSKMYPGLFSAEDLPADIAAHTRYSERLFKLQADVYKKYHVSQPETLYSNSDIWVNAREKYNDGEPVDVAPYYNLMKLEGETELVLMQPFTPQGKENLVSWMAGRTDGQIYIYTFPKGETVYGTLHIENKIDNDPGISKEISLWNQGGSSVVKGNLLVIPVENSLLYVEPIYITTQNTAAIPEVKRVVVAYGENVIMAENIETALSQLFTVTPPRTEPEAEDETPIEAEGDLSAVAQNIVDKYTEAKRYSMQGDYESYGKAMAELDKEVEKYNNIINNSKE